MALYSAYSDGELLGFLRQGDPLAFAEIYNRYHQPVYRYLITLLNVPELTEDAVHDVFIRLWDRREKLEIKENFAGYLFRICHNMAIDMIKKIAGERLQRDQLLYHYQQFVSLEWRSSEELERYDHLVEEALNTLSPQRRKVFELCKKQGKSYQEVAEVLQISPNTVREHMVKALSILKNFLHDKGELIIALILLRKIF